MKEAVTKVIDMHTQEDFHGACEKLLERYNEYIAAGGKISYAPHVFKKKYFSMFFIRRHQFSISMWRLLDPIKRNFVCYPARTYIHQLCVNTKCRLEDFSGGMNGKDQRRES